MVVLADTGYKYLPDNLKNKNYLSEFFLHVKKGLNSPADKVIYSDIIKALGDYLESVQIEQIQGSIEASPITGNAPLTVTLR